ncbi:Uncharacterized protein APZ42_028722 [Daphnia magna]|uniref:Uncharacterized protein n=1 Tax=Daphnia magna TaxID=35525 RepID=A0A0P4XU85_9CRUS|nr:Uncharacterized protein APZ42_028722 [Daphnia magna]
MISRAVYCFTLVCFCFNLLYLKVQSYPLMANEGQSTLHNGTDISLKESVEALLASLALINQ